MVAIELAEDGLEKLITTHTIDFIKKHSKDNFLEKPIEKKSTLKIASTDIFEDTVNLLVSEYLKEKNTIFLSQAGGSDSALSLYANISGASDKDHKPQMLLVDRNPWNLQNQFYRLMLTRLNPTSRMDYVLDMFGVDDSVLSKKIPAQDFKPIYLEKIISQIKYDPEFHLDNLLSKSQDTIKDAKLRKVFEMVSKNIVTWLDRDKNYKLFMNNFLDVTRSNPNTHYLNDDNLYLEIKRAIKSNGKGDGRYNIQFIGNEDISKPEGLQSVSKLLSKYGIRSEQTKPIDIAYIPHLKNMDSLIPFLKDTTRHVIQCHRDLSTQNRHWVVKSSDELIPAMINTPGVRKYKEEYNNRVTFKKFSDSPGFDGVPRTLYLPPLLIGNAYADEKVREYFSDIAIGTGVKNIITGDAIYGTYFFQGNARRGVYDQEYRSLDSRLKKFTNYRKKLEDAGIQIHYNIGDDDKSIIYNLYRLFLAEKNKLNTGKTKIKRRSVIPEREEYNSTNDWAQNILELVGWPYFLRKGEDVALIFDEEGEKSRVIELLEGLSRYNEGRKLGKYGELLDVKALENNNGFHVGWEHVIKFKNKKKEEVGINVMGNTLFSNATQYVNPTMALEEIVKMSQNGLLKNLPEPILVDTRQAYQMLKVQDHKVLIFTPHITDDRRYFDKEFLPNKKKIPADPVHKRVTIAKRLNLPGGWITEGDPNTGRMYIEPYYPKIFERMEKVQRTGKGYRDFNVAIIQDVQINSVTERPRHLLNGLDYAFLKRGAIGAICVGDLIQGRNYRDMPNENAILGGLSVNSQKKGLVNLLRPFFTLPQIEFWDAVYGNHEENTDRDAVGITFLTSLEEAIEQHKMSTGSDMDIQFPEFVMSKEGDYMKAPFGYRSLNDLGIIYAHKFSERGAGKGSGTRPSTHITSWFRNMGKLGIDYDIGLAGHYHIVEMLVQDNKFAAVLGAYAGESGYEFRRQYGGAEPVTAILHFKEDGRFGVELLFEHYLDKLKVQHPEIKKVGVDDYINKCFRQKVTVLAPEEPKHQDIYRRDYETSTPKKI